MIAAADRHFAQVGEPIHTIYSLQSSRAAQELLEHSFHILSRGEYSNTDLVNVPGCASIFSNSSLALNWLY